MATRERSEAIMASDLVADLTALIAEHGDLPVFNRADWNWVEVVEVFSPDGFDGSCIAIE